MNWNLWIGFVLFQVIASAEDNRRPFWNIAHMVNTLNEVDKYLDQGANSLEFDITFDGPNPVLTYHPFPCDCWRVCALKENIDTYLEYMRNITSPGSTKYRKQLVLLFMDLKLSSVDLNQMKSAGENMAKKLIDTYWKKGESGGEAFILLSVQSVKQMNFIHAFLETLERNNATFRKDKIGFDFSGNEDLSTIEYVLETNKVSSDHFWQGDGITNCLPRSTRRLKEALNRRDFKETSYISKVYWWTVDRRITMESVLRLDVDGLITNYPHRLTDLIEESHFASNFRLATLEDNPWNKHPAGKPYSLPDYCTSPYADEEILHNLDDA